MSDLTKLSLTEKIKLAKDENTSSQILAQFSREDHKVRQLVAGNPNTSVTVLTKLYTDYADEIKSNPIFNLLLLEDPNSTLVKMYLASSSNTPLTTLIRLSQDKDQKVNRLVARNKSLSKDTQALLARVGSRWFLEEAFFKGKDSSSSSGKVIPDEILRELVLNPNLLYHQTYTLIDEYKLTLETLRIMAKNSSSVVREVLAERKETPADILRNLSRDEENNVRQGVFEREFLNIKSYKQRLEKIASSVDWQTRKKAADNHHTPLHILKSLVDDECEYVRMA